MHHTVKMEMIAKPDWMIYDDTRDMFDVEKQLYILLAMEQKFNAAMKSGDVTRFYEIVFHFLNINSLNADRKLYDAHFREIKGNKYLAEFVSDLGTDKNGPAAQIVQQANEVYTRIISSYMNFAIGEISDSVAVYFDPKNIHYFNTEVFVLFNVKPHDNRELWRVTFNTDANLGSTMSHIGDFEMRAGETDDFRKFVREFNKANPVNRVRAGNFVAVTSDSARDSKNVVSVIKDIILLNKIFYEKMQFNGRVLHDMQQIIIDKKTFPFKLLVQ